MSAEPRICVRRVIVRKASRCHDDVDLDSRLKALLPKRQALQFVQSELLGCAVDGGVLEQDLAHTVVVDCRLDRSAATEVLRVLGILELPRVAALVVQQAWVVVTLVEVFEDAGKDLGLSTTKRLVCSSNQTAEASRIYSSSSSTFFEALSRNWPLSAALKKGDKERTSSCAAKRR